MGPEFWTNLAIALGLGLAVAAVISLFRRYDFVRRVRVSALLTALGGGVWLVMRGLNQPATTLPMQVVIAFTILLGANTLLQLFDWLLWDYAFARRRGVTVPRLVVDIFNLVVLVAVSVGVLNQVFGITDLSGLLVTSTVVSAVIGLALQDTLGNVISGLALQLEHPFTVGDWVEVGDQEGQVMQMSWRSVTLRTRDHHNVFIPNANIARQLVINFSRPTTLQRIHAHVNIAYGHPPGLVKEVLEKAVAEALGVVPDPAPRAVVKEFGEFSIHYEILYWITDFARLVNIHDDVLTRVWYALRRANVSIPFPMRDVTVRMLTEDHEAQARALQRKEIIAALRPLPILAPLSDSQIEQLAQTATRQRFYAGERLVRQGEAGESLFVITSGRVRVEKQLDDGAVVLLAHLGRDEFFGEMSLLTGERRSASVIAEEDTEVLVVGRGDMASVITSDARILEQLSMALDARMQNTGERVAAATGPLGKKSDGQPSDLLARIRRFFGVGASV